MSLSRLEAQLELLRASVWQALEEIEEQGDPRAAAALLRSALIEGRRDTNRCRCRSCGRGFEFPGQLDEHLRLGRCRGQEAA